MAVPVKAIFFPFPVDETSKPRDVTVMLPSKILKTPQIKEVLFHYLKKHDPKIGWNEKENIKSFYPHDTPHKYLFVTYIYPENHRFNNRNFLVDEWMYDTTPEITQFFKGPVFVFKFVKVIEGSWIYTICDNSLPTKDDVKNVVAQVDSKTEQQPIVKNVIAKPKTEQQQQQQQQQQQSTRQKVTGKNISSKTIWPQQPDATSTSPSESPRNLIQQNNHNFISINRTIQKPMLDPQLGGGGAFSLYSDIAMTFGSGQLTPVNAINIPEDFFELPQITADLWPPYILANPSESLSQLCDMAEEEVWDKKNMPLAILYEYISLIFRGAVRNSTNPNLIGSRSSICMNKDSRKCIVNTGLLTRRGPNEYILALCHRMPDSRFIVKNFVTWWDAVQSYGFEHCEMPPPVTFFSHDDILFDNKLQLQFNVEHLIDRFEYKFPQRWRNLKREELRMFLHGLTESLRRQVENDSTCVVPAVCTNTSELSLQYLLPLRMEPDLVIAVEKKGQYYMAQNILRAESEYAKARVLGKVKGWLQDS
jgi:hypothetical protein